MFKAFAKEITASLASSVCLRNSLRRNTNILNGFHATCPANCPLPAISGGVRFHNYSSRMAGRMTCEPNINNTIQCNHIQTVRLNALREVGRAGNERTAAPGQGDGGMKVGAARCRRCITVIIGLAAIGSALMVIKKRRRPLTTPQHEQNIVDIQASEKTGDKASHCHYRSELRASGGGERRAVTGPGDGQAVCKRADGSPDDEQSVPLMDARDMKGAASCQYSVRTEDFSSYT
ncbi:unnamed protein product [Spodoptera exigua]|nr:unnamed protein product [Spodoptera exigua]